MTIITPGDKWGDPRTQAHRANAMAQANVEIARHGIAGRPPSDVNAPVPWHPGAPQYSGWYGPEWQHGRSPEEQAVLRERFESFVPKVVSRGSPGRAQDFFASILPPGAQLAPNAGAGYRQAQRNHHDMRRRGMGGFSGLPSGAQPNGGDIFQQVQQPYQPEFCAVEGSPIVLADGSVKPIEEISVGDRVLDKNGSVQTVEAAWCSGTPSELVEITTWGTKKILVTKQHNLPIWAWSRTCECGCGGSVTPGRLYVQDHYKGGRLQRTGIHVRGSAQRSGGGHQRIPTSYEPRQKLRAEDVRRHDFMLVPRKFDPVTTETTEDEARLLGYYVAEGSFAKGVVTAVEFYGVELTFGLHERETWVADAVRILRSLGADPSVYDREETHSSRIRTRNDRGKNANEVSALCSWLFKHGGRDSHEKKLSEEVMRWPIKLKREFVRGLLRGDGHQSWRISAKKGYVGRAFGVHHVTVSETLHRQVQLILSQIGWPARKSLIKETKRDFKGKIHDCKAAHILNIPAPFAMDAADFIWGGQSQAKLYPRLENIRPECMIDDDFVYVPVKSVRTITNTKRTYNLTVSGDHSYLIDGLGSYNSSPDRQSYPVHRSLANIYWRLFYKLDYVAGSGVDLFSELPWGDVEFTGEGLDGEIKDTCEIMWEDCKVRSLLPFFVREHLVTGEIGVHNYYDQNKGRWSYVALHNPDQLEVIYTPFIKMDPIVRFKPDNRLQQVLASSSPMLSHVRESIPPDLLSALMGGQAIELHPLNFTFLPRRMHPYDVRGTSIFSRMWRIFMLEDAIYNASIAVARRASSPLKIAKLGDRATGWIPDPSHEAKLHELLAASELDPTAWLVYHYGIEFDLVGVQERTWKIEQSAEFIDRVKLMALGLSKSFLWGEVTYACIIEGLRVKRNYILDTQVEKIKTGDIILDRDNKPQTVLKAWSEGVPETLTEIELTGGKTLQATHNHRWPVWAWPRKCACGCGEELVKTGSSVLHGHGGRAKARGVAYIDVDQSADPRRIPVGYDPMKQLRSDELRVGDCLLVPRRFEEIKPDCSLQQARLLGYYLSEGSRKAYNATGRYQTTFSLSRDESETLAVDIENLCCEYGANTFRGYGDLETSENRLYVTTTREAGLDLYDWFLQHGGHDADKKQISEEVMRWPLEYKRELVRGIYLGDGWQTLSTQKYKGKISGPYLQVGYSTASEIFARQLHEMLIQLGFFAPVEHRERVDNRPGWPERTIEYQLDLQSDGAIALADLVWKDESKSREVKRERNVRPLVRMDENYAYVPIRRVRSILNTKPVYNIEVTGSHTYQVEGVATYNSAQSGLTVFLQRLLALREYIETEWIIPKFFRPISVMRRWVKPTPAELSHNVRTRRSHEEIVDDRRYIVPELKWARKLEPSIDQAKITAVQALQQLGIVFSKQTLASIGNADWEEEFTQRGRETEIEKKILAKYPALQTAMLPPGGAEGGAGGGGMGMMPGLPPESMGGEPGPPGEGGGAGGEPPMPPEAGVHAGPGEPSAPGGPDGRAWQRPDLWQNGQYRGWEAPVVADLIRVFEGDQPQEDLWERMLERMPQLRKTRDGADFWEGVEDWLVNEGYPSSSILSLEDVLKHEGILTGMPAVKASNIDDLETEDTDLFIGTRPRR